MGDKRIRVRLWFLYIGEHPNFTGCLIDEDNTIVWFKNGQRHREDGPALEYTYGTKRWFLNGKRYRTEHEHRIAVRQMKMKLLDVM